MNCEYTPHREESFLNLIRTTKYKVSFSNDHAFHLVGFEMDLYSYLVKLNRIAIRFWIMKSSKAQMRKKIHQNMLLSFGANAISHKSVCGWLSTTLEACIEEYFGLFLKTRTWTHHSSVFF